MGIDNFKEEEGGKPFTLDTDVTDVRPRVPEASHEKVRDFTAESGLQVSTAYGMIINTVLDNDVILDQVLSTVSDDIEELTQHHHDLLEDIADIVDAYGEFPDRQAINEDTMMLGYPIYIMHFGSKERLMEALKTHYPDVYSNIE